MTPMEAASSCNSEKEREKEQTTLGARGSNNAACHDNNRRVATWRGRGGRR